MNHASLHLFFNGHWGIKPDGTLLVNTKLSDWDNGVIAIRFWHRHGGNAMVQAIEIGPGAAPAGARPVSFQFPAEAK